jgi:hypothetical protein
MQSAFYADSPAVAETVTALALDYRLMSQYTSFVAVDDSQPAAEGPVAPPHRMLVPVPLPAGTRWEGFFGQDNRGIDGLDLADGRLLNRGSMPVQFEALREQSQIQAISGIVAGVPVTVNGPLPASASPAARPANESLRRSNLALGFGGFGGGGGGFGGGGQANLGGRLAGQRGRGGRGGRGRGLPTQLGAQLANQPAMLQEQRARASIDRYMRFDDRIIDQAEVSVRSKFAIADKLAEGRDLEWFNPPASNADPTAYVFAWEQTEAGPAHFDALAQAAYAAAKKAIEDKDVATARLELQRAVFYTEAQANRRGVQNDVSAEATAQLQQLRGEQIAEWKKASPWLNARLDLVLRNVPADSAIAQVLAAVQQMTRGDVATFEIIADSLADAASLGSDTRIHYLDLRGANVADALDWILLPARLTWQLDGEKVTVASARRLPGESCWVYDVAEMALPRHSELGDPANQAEYLANAQKQCDAVLAAVRTRLGGAKESVQWFAPGQLLIVGDTAAHTQAAAFFAELADTNREATSDLHRLARERAAARKAATDVAEAAGAQLRALVGLEAFGWPLLRNAAAGKVDLEALTELQIAWESLDHAKLPAGTRSLVLRTAWIVNESARALQDETELTKFAAMLAEDTRDASGQAVDAVVASGEHAAGEYLAATYAALARRDDVEFARRASQAISSRTEQQVAWLTRAVAPALLGPEGDGPQSQLAELVRSGQVVGEDAVLLTALACRRAGGEAWTAFRAESSTLLGRQPLAGDVVVLVNELSSTRLPLVVAVR